MGLMGLGYILAAPKKLQIKLITCTGDLRDDVLQIQASNNAFAAIRIDGSVVCWGFANEGGDSSASEGWTSMHSEALNPKPLTL